MNKSPSPQQTAGTSILKKKKRRLDVSDAELLKMARSFDAGPPIAINGRLVEEWRAAGFKYVDRDLERYHYIVQYRGGGRWAIQDGPDSRRCLNKLGEWEFESLPSERTEEYFRRTRFRSPLAALSFLNRWKVKEHRRLAEESKNLPSLKGPT